MAMEKPANSEVFLSLAIMVIPGNIVNVAKINFSAYGILNQRWANGIGVTVHEVLISVKEVGRIPPPGSL